MKESNNDDGINYRERFISSSNKWLYGNILIKATTVSVTSIINDLAEGKSFSEIINFRPGISQSDIKLCLKFAAELSQAVDFDKAIPLINVTRNAQRKVFLDIADRIHKLRGTFSKFNDENIKDSDTSMD